METYTRAEKREMARQKETYGSVPRREFARRRFKRGKRTVTFLVPPELAQRRADAARRLSQRRYGW